MARYFPYGLREGLDGGHGADILHGDEKLEELPVQLMSEADEDGLGLPFGLVEGYVEAQVVLGLLRPSYLAHDECRDEDIIPDAPDEKGQALIVDTLQLALKIGYHTTLR